FHVTGVQTCALPISGPEAAIARRMSSRVTRPPRSNTSSKNGSSHCRQANAARCTPSRMISASGTPRRRATHRREEARSGSGLSRIPKHPGDLPYRVQLAGGDRRDQVVGGVVGEGQPPTVDPVEGDQRTESQPLVSVY